MAGSNSSYQKEDGPETKLLTNMDKKEKSANIKKYKDMDSLLGFGNFQHFQIWVFQTIIAILGAVNYFHIVFIVSDPPHWYCATEDGQKIEEEGRCGAEGELCPVGELVYNTSHLNYFYSLPVQHGWLCSKELWGPSVITSTAIGMLFNSLTFGQLCDTLGRVRVIHITNIIFLLFRLISFHVTEYYALFLFLTAAGTCFFPVGVRAGYTLVAEYCNDAGRKYAFISGWVWWVFGMCITPFIAQYINDWYMFGLVTTLCNILVVVLYPLVPESPRLLCSKKKFKEAAEVISTIRKYNSEEKIENLQGLLEEMANEEEECKSLGVLSLFKEKSLLRLMVCMAVLYSANDYFYFAGQLNSANLAGSMYVNHALLALTELPSVFIGQFLIDRFGRRWIHVLCMVLVTVCYTINIVIVNMENADNAVLAFSLVAKTVSNVAWFVMWVQSIEVFPTLVRNSGINLSVVISICMSMTTPYVMALDKIDKSFPYIVFVLIGASGIVFTSLVPETKGVRLPDSVEELDKLLGNMRFFELRPWLRTKDGEKDSVEMF